MPAEALSARAIVQLCALIRTPDEKLPVGEVAETRVEIVPELLASVTVCEVVELLVSNEATHSVRLMPAGTVIVRVIIVGARTGASVRAVARAGRLDFSPR